jgi:chromate transporter
VIDDDTPIPVHARFSWVRVALYTTVGLGLWMLAIGTSQSTVFLNV